MGTNMGSQNALVCSQKTLARLMGCSVDTVQRATAVLVGEGWIQTVRLNGPGTVLAYVINSAVTWSEQHDRSRLATFKAQVVADAEDQPPELLECKDLQRIPTLHSNNGPDMPSYREQNGISIKEVNCEFTWRKEDDSPPKRWRLDTEAMKRQAEAMARLKGETEPE
jgi:DNA-binding transcriptional MocR family regulator